MIEDSNRIQCALFPKLTASYDDICGDDDRKEY